MFHNQITFWLLSEIKLYIILVQINKDICEKIVNQTSSHRQTSKKICCNIGFWWVFYMKRTTKNLYCNSCNMATIRQIPEGDFFFFSSTSLISVQPRSQQVCVLSRWERIGHISQGMKFTLPWSLVLVYLWALLDVDVGPVREPLV